MKKRRLDHLDIARGAAIILMVWGHADRRLDASFFQENLALIGDIIYAFHISLLFVISGTLQRNRFENYSFQSIVKQNLRTILIPFFSLSFLFMGLILIVPKGVLESQTFMELLQGTFFMQSSETYAPSGVLWFFFVLFTGMLISAFLYKKLGMKFWQIFIIAVIIKLSSQWVNDVTFLALNKFTRNYVFMVFGLMVAGKVKNVTTGHHEFLIDGIALILFVLFFAGMDIFKPFFQLMTGIIGSFILLRMSWMAAKLRLKLFDMLKYVGTHSVLIYVFHMPFFKVIEPLINKCQLTYSFAGLGLWVFLGCSLPLCVGAVLRTTPALHLLLLGKPARKYPAKRFAPLFKRGVNPSNIT